LFLKTDRVFVLGSLLGDTLYLQRDERIPESVQRKNEDLKIRKGLLWGSPFVEPE
jgi:hypothetical protein